MMRRQNKRKIKKTILVVFLGVLMVVVAIVIFFSFKSFVNTFNKFAVESSNPIVKPLGVFTSSENIQALLDDKNIILESIDSTSSAIIVAKIKGGPRVYFSKNRDASWQVNSLQLILSKLTIDNKKPNLIDLRFDRPIVKF